MSAGNEDSFRPVSGCRLCSFCPAPQALIPVLIPSADETSWGVGGGASERGEALGAALPETQRPREGWLLFCALETRVTQEGHQPRGWGLCTLELRSELIGTKSLDLI